MIPMKKRFSFPISEAKGRDSEDSANKCCPWNGDPIQEVHMRRGDRQIETEWLRGKFTHCNFRGKSSISTWNEEEALQGVDVIRELLYHRSLPGKWYKFPTNQTQTCRTSRYQISVFALDNDNIKIRLILLATIITCDDETLRDQVLQTKECSSQNEVNCTVPSYGEYFMRCNPIRSGDSEEKRP